MDIIVDGLNQDYYNKKALIMAEGMTGVKGCLLCVNGQRDILVGATSVCKTGHASVYSAKTEDSAIDVAHYVLFVENYDKMHTYSFKESMTNLGLSLVKARKEGKLDPKSGCALCDILIEGTASRLKAFIAVIPSTSAEDRNTRILELMPFFEKAGCFTGEQLNEFKNDVRPDPFSGAAIRDDATFRSRRDASPLLNPSAS